MATSQQHQAQPFEVEEPEQNFSDKLADIKIWFESTKYRSQVLFVSFLSLLLVAALWWWQIQTDGRTEIPIEESIPFAQVVSTAGADKNVDLLENDELTVHIIGEVKNPGLVQLPVASRVAEAIESAGGFTAEADLQQLNLAATLVDGSQIKVPLAGAISPGPLIIEPQPIDEDTQAEIVSVHLNQATGEELEKLPGVGPSLASSIIQHRLDMGAFRSVDDLLDVVGIGPAKLEKIRDFVYL